MTYLDNGMALGMFAITPSDSVDLVRLARGFKVDTAGVIKLTTLNGDTVTSTFAAGYHPIIVKRFWAASLTADGIFGLD